jgi:hypothetical protein
MAKNIIRNESEDLNLIKQLIGIDQSKAGLLTQTGWELAKNLIEADWKAAGAALVKIDSSMSWWIGDWWAFGERRYGERKAMVESDEWDGPVYQSCKDAAWVCGVFEKSRRRDFVSFIHHREAASLPIAEADQVLDWCEKTWKTTGRLPTIKATREYVKQIKNWLEQGWTQSQLMRKAMVETGHAVVASHRVGENGKANDAALIAWADQQNLMVRIDRQTEWGNPFEMPSDGDRDMVCDNYANHYLPFKPSLIKKLSNLKGKVLVCWCHPERCHGDHLAREANNYDR